MPFQIVRADITTMQVDAIVNAANRSLLGGGGVDGAIHKAAGSELLKECEALGGCETGGAKLTKGYKLNASYIIHTVGPVWHGGDHQEEKLLRSCYQESLRIGAEKGLSSIAFPLISAGIYGYPREQALQVAIEEITKFLLSHEMMIFLVVYNRDAFAISKKLFADVKSFIDDHLVIPEDPQRGQQLWVEEADFLAAAPCLMEPSGEEGVASPSRHYAGKERKLEELLAQVGETFAEQLLRLIDQKGKTDVEVYKGANLDRKLFSKIRSDREYRPSKATALALAISLRLNLDETSDLLAKAGYALSPCSRADLIIEYFIRQGDYDIFQINEALFAFDQHLLGA